MSILPSKFALRTRTFFTLLILTKQKFTFFLQNRFPIAGVQNPLASLGFLWFPSGLGIHLPTRARVKMTLFSRGKLPQIILLPYYIIILLYYYILREFAFANVPSSWLGRGGSRFGTRLRVTISSSEPWEPWAGAEVQHELDLDAGSSKREFLIVLFELGEKSPSSKCKLSRKI